MPDKHRVTRIVKTNAANPAEWQGLTREGRGVYVRYSGGELTIYLGHSDDGPELAEANGRMILLKVVAIDDPNAGTMTLSDLKSHTVGFVDWPDAESEHEED